MRAMSGHLPWPSNIWLGTSVENDLVIGRVNVLKEVPAAVRFLSCEPLLGPLTQLDFAGIDWVIVGGESGPKHRPIETEWLYHISDLCIRGDVPFFFKQWGGGTPKSGGRLRDGHIWNGLPRGVARTMGVAAAAGAATKGSMPN